MNLPAIILKPGRDASLRRNHHWIFSGGIQKTAGTPKEGDLVIIQSSNGERLGFGHFSDSNISVRVLQFGTQDWTDEFWSQTILAAFRLRAAIGLTDDPKIYNKSKESLGQQSSVIENEFFLGETQETLIIEHGYRFKVNWVTGQKTGFFLDQRANRKIVSELCHGKSVLNLFSYSGGFSIYALESGAIEVVSVDVSAKAIELTEDNVALIRNTGVTHQSYCQNVNEYIRDCDLFDIIICDPPAFAKSLNKRHQALIGYKNLNAKVLKKVKSGGLLFTFSCSQVMDRELFQQTILAAALDSNRKVKILQHLSQGPDHPTNIYHPEGSYLKGLLLYIED